MSLGSKADHKKISSLSKTAAVKVKLVQIGGWREGEVRYGVFIFFKECYKFFIEKDIKNIDFSLYYI